MNRRTFLKALGLCALAPIAVAKAASKIAELPKEPKMPKWVPPRTFSKHTWIDDDDPILDVGSAYAMAHARAVNRMKDKIILEALLNG